MVINYYIMPRQSGKTTGAIANALKLNNKGKKILIVALNNHNAQDIKFIGKSISEHFENIDVISAEKFSNAIRKNIYDAIILDEYLFFSLDQKKEIYSMILALQTEVVYIYTTSDKVYGGIDLEYTRNYLNGKITIQKPEFYDESLLYSFICNKETNLFNMKLEYGPRIEMLKDNLSSTDYSTEVIGYYRTI